ncbi:nucleoside monophosphate kinase [Candidatus Saccharibacteria bacterium]|nr:nucleoside monophosphate kinase [Candidatus Saccharibacteria bacterium]
MNVVAVFGPAGSGKSTQAKLLADRFGWVHISVGNLLREVVSDPNDPDGEFLTPEEKAQMAIDMQAGNMLNQEIVWRVMLSEFKKLPQGSTVLLDGHLREIGQAEQLLNSGHNIILAIELLVTIQEATRRIMSRADDRADDTPDAIEKRHAIYEQNFETIRAYLESHGVPFLIINANGSIEETSTKLLNRVTEMLGAPHAENA